jgi:hypothetical protein
MPRPTALKSGVSKMVHDGPLLHMWRELEDLGFAISDGTERTGPFYLTDKAYDWQERE